MSGSARLHWKPLLFLFFVYVTKKAAPRISGLELSLWSPQPNLNQLGGEEEAERESESEATKGHEEEHGHEHSQEESQGRATSPDILE